MNCLGLIHLLAGCTTKWSNRPITLHQKRLNMDNEKINKGRNRLAIKLKKRDMSVSVFGLEKVPAEPLLKMALEEIGEQESYIEELEEKIKHIDREREASWKQERKALVHEVKSEAFLLAQRNLYYSKLELRLGRAGERIRRLIDVRNELLRENLALKKRIEQLSEYCNEK